MYPSGATDLSNAEAVGTQHRFYSCCGLSSLHKRSSLVMEHRAAATARDEEAGLLLWPWVMQASCRWPAFRLQRHASLHWLHFRSIHYLLTCTFLLHPASCHTSTLLRLCQAVLHGHARSTSCRPVQRLIDKYRLHDLSQLMPLQGISFSRTPFFPAVLDS